MSSLLQELRALELELHHPGARCSPRRLEELLHPQFHEVGRSGRQYSRETVVRHLLAEVARSVVESTGFQCDSLSEGCALLTYQTADRAGDGQLTRKAHRASVWLRTGAGWQLLYHQATPAADE